MDILEHPSKSYLFLFTMTGIQGYILQVPVKTFFKMLQNTGGHPNHIDAHFTLFITLMYS